MPGRHAIPEGVLPTPPPFMSASPHLPRCAQWGLPLRRLVCVLAGTQLLRLLRPPMRVSPPENCSRWVQTKQLGIDGVCREINQRRLAVVPGAAWA